MAKKEQIIERTYNVPLRKEYQKVPRWRKTKKAVKALREFLVRHMKSENIKLDEDVNNELWKHGIRNPPHHLKVVARKDDKGAVNVTLFGVKESSKKNKPTKGHAKSSKNKETTKSTKTEEAIVEQNDEEKPKTSS
jgi:large subunit ribosomal protein L31e